jgi:hypothetical protein
MTSGLVHSGSNDHKLLERYESSNSVSHSLISTECFWPQENTDRAPHVNGAMNKLEMLNQYSDWLWDEQPIITKSSEWVNMSFIIHIRETFL